jgi:hypothetical protein
LAQLLLENGDRHVTAEGRRAAIESRSGCARQRDIGLGWTSGKQNPTGSARSRCSRDRSPCLFLDDGATVSHPAAGAYVVDQQADEIAASELAVDRKVEQGKISRNSVPGL